MKKLTKGLALLHLSFATQTFAAVPTGIPHYYINLPTFYGGTTFGLTAFFARSGVSSLNYALVFPNFDPLGNTIFQNGSDHSLDQNSTWGFKINLGYIFPCTSHDVQIAFTHYGHDDKEVSLSPGNANLLPSVSPTWRDGFLLGVRLPAITATVAGVSNSILIPSGTEIFTTTINPDFAAAKTDFDYSAFDLEFGQLVNIGLNLRVHWHGGIRFAELDNRLNVFFSGVRENSRVVPSINAAEITPTEITFDIVTNVSETVNQKSYFQGLGPRLGLDASYHVFCGFGVVADFSASLIIGQHHSKLLQEFNESATATVTAITPGIATGDLLTTDISTAVGSVFSTLVSNTDEAPNSVVDFSHDRSMRIVPNIDAKLGINYTFQYHNCSRTQVILEAGWLASYYLDVVDRDSLQAVLFPENRSKNTLDMGYQGPYLGIQVNL